MTYSYITNRQKLRIIIKHALFLTVGAVGVDLRLNLSVHVGRAVLLSNASSALGKKVLTLATETANGAGVEGPTGRVLDDVQARLETSRHVLSVSNSGNTSNKCSKRKFHIEFRGG